MKHITRILLIVVAIVGLTIGMSTITSCSSKSDDAKTAVSNKVDEVKADVKDAKYGGDDANAAVSDAKEDVGEAKCGEGKCGEGKCGGDEAKAEVSDKADEAKCGEGKCG